MPDKTNALSYVRLISQNENEIVIHWRYEPSFSVLPNPYQFKGVEPKEFVDEYYIINSNGVVKRTIRVGTEKIDEWDNMNSLIIQKFNLDISGFKDVSFVKSKLNQLNEEVEKNFVERNVSYNPVSVWSFDEGRGDFTKN